MLCGRFRRKMVSHADNIVRYLDSIPVYENCVSNEVSQTKRGDRLIMYIILRKDLVTEQGWPTGAMINQVSGRTNAKKMNFFSFSHGDLIDDFF